MSAEYNPYVEEFIKSVDPDAIVLRPTAVPRDASPFWKRLNRNTLREQYYYVYEIIDYINEGEQLGPDVVVDSIDFTIQFIGCKEALDAHIDLWHHPYRFKSTPNLHRIEVTVQGVATEINAELWQLEFTLNGWLY